MPASRAVGGRSRMRLPSLANVRIRSKLGLILIVPVLAILTLTALRLSDASSRANDARLVGALTALSADASRVAHEVHHERMSAAVLLSDPKVSEQAYLAQTKKTDDAVNAYRDERRHLGDIPGNVSDRLNRIDTQLTALDPIREQVSGRKGASVSETMLRYGLIIDDLVSYRESLSQVTSNADLGDALTAAAAFSKAKALLSDQESIVYPALTTGTLTDQQQQYASFVATLTGQQEAMVTFALAASATQSAIVDQTIAGDAVQLADDVTTDLSRATALRPSQLTASDAIGPMDAVNDLMRFAEAQIDQDLIKRTSDISAGVRREVLVESTVIVVVLIIVIALALGTARSMIRTLSRLRHGALAVADYELAEAVNQLKDVQSLDDRTPEQIASEVRDSIGIDTKDEVGEVAKAFHIVHQEAVRIAAEQAVLRASVSAMFLNLARRSQTLVDRMIGQLDSIERGEEDPKRLAQLFKLDHLATRMRRNDENVLVLAGADSTPPRRDDAPLFDVLRAAQSEVEQYERIEFTTIDDDVSIAARAVNDVVRLLAELLDNATRLSPPSESVHVEGRRIGDRVHLQIEDRGIGIDPASMHMYNARFAAPPSIDVTTFRMMGLAVVGRLAYRNGIGIQLRDNPGGGTVVELMFPADVLILPPVWVRQDSLPGRRSQQLPAGPPVPALEMPTAPQSSLGMPPVQRQMPPAAQHGFGMPGGDLPTRPTTPREQPAPSAGGFSAQPSAGGFPSQSQPSAGGFPSQSQPSAGGFSAKPSAGGFPSQPVAGGPSAPGGLPTRPRSNNNGQRPPAEPERSFQTPRSAPPAQPTSPAPVAPPTPVAGPPSWPPAQLSTPVPAAPPQAPPVRTPPPAPAPEPVRPAAQEAMPIGVPPADDTTELPIYREIEAAWFRTHGNTQAISVYNPDAPAAGRQPQRPAQPQPTYVPAPARPAQVPQTGQAVLTPPPVQQRPAPIPVATATADERWRTAADDGWRAAAAAASPPVDSKTRIGLPKRQPGAQLVPGGVETKATARTRRTPEEVRGLLSTYQRGVQRGRSANSGDVGTSGTAEGSGR